MKTIFCPVWRPGRQSGTQLLLDAVAAGPQLSHVVVSGGTPQHRLEMVDALHRIGPFRNREPVTMDALCQRAATVGRQAAFDGTQARDVLVLDPFMMGLSAVQLLDELICWGAAWEARATAHLPVPPRILATLPLPQSLASAPGRRWTHLVINEGVVVRSRPGQSAGSRRSTPAKE